MVEPDLSRPHPHSFWARLGQNERAALRKIGVRRVFPTGSILCHQGEESLHVLIVLAGHVRVTRLAADGREVVAGIRGPGDILGELAAVDAQPRSATLSALATVDALTIPGPRFSGLCQSEPRITWALLGVVVDRLRESNRQWAEFGGGPAAQRTIALLLELAVSQGTPTAAGVEITLWGSQQELATTAGTSRESMARGLRALREQGLISTRRGRIIIHDLARLRRLAG